MKTLHHASAVNMLQKVNEAVGWSPKQQAKDAAMTTVTQPSATRRALKIVYSNME